MKKSSLKLVLAVLVLAIIGLSVGIWFVVQNNKQVVIEGGDQGQNPNERIIYPGELTVDDYLEWIDEQISNTTDPEEKANLYMGGSIQLSNFQVQDGANYSEKILEYAYKAEELYPSAQSAYLIYSFENKFGNKEVADEFLNIAKERGYVETNVEG